mmetsp:Transcript_3737/g.5665  ORF Transcript_3737/g.5665 Transcript_3737/m.5665 type:complete len:90 (-) Transcript_3737:14-283(-)
MKRHGASFLRLCLSSASPPPVQENNLRTHFSSHSNKEAWSRKHNVGVSVPPDIQQALKRLEPSTSWGSLPFEVQQLCFPIELGGVGFDV